MLFIDGDIVLYRAAFASEKVVPADDWAIPVGDLREARERVLADLEAYREELCDPDCVVALTDPNDNWRAELYPEYKQNRRHGLERRPVLWEPLRDWLVAELGALFIPTLEADDVLGLHAGDGIIVSEDKDLRTIPGRLYNPRTRTLDVITEEEANRNHLLQTLIGDSTDNYPGCPGVGAVRAAKIVEGGWEAVVEAYVQAGLTDEDALVQARIAYILRPGDYDEETQEVRLWCPDCR